MCRLTVATLRDAAHWASLLREPRRADPGHGGGRGPGHEPARRSRQPAASSQTQPGCSVSTSTVDLGASIGSVLRGAGVVVAGLPVTAGGIDVPPTGRVLGQLDESGVATTRFSGFGAYPTPLWSRAGNGTAELGSWERLCKTHAALIPSAPLAVGIYRVVLEDVFAMVSTERFLMLGLARSPGYPQDCRRSIGSLAPPGHP